MPDQVVLTLGVESLDRDLAKAKATNDQRVRSIFVVARSNGLEDKDIQTDQISIEPQWEYSSSRRQFLGYQVRKTVALTLRDLSKFEGLLGAALEAGANYVHGIQFSTTKLRAHRDAARVSAIGAAREKAVALAKEMGMKVGKPLSIGESGGGSWSSYGFWGERYASRSQNVMQEAAGGAGGMGGATAPGTISVTATVAVTFDLLD